MKKQLLKILTLTLIIACLGAVPLQAETKHMQWITIQNLKDRNGNPLSDRNVYGYFQDFGSNQIFVECDSTGKPSGRCYYNTQEIKVTTEEVVVDYQKKKYEDWTKTKRVDPVDVTLMAPNVMTGTSWDWDYYDQTGEMRSLAKGPVQWPGNTGAYLIPGSDPDYWLIVAKVYNPNPFSVKATVSVDLSDWRNGFSEYDNNNALALTKNVDVILEANDTKFVLINRGKKYPIIGEEIEWRSEVNMDAWSEAYYTASVTENLDPELPDSLKPNKGFISFTNYSGKPPEPNNLSGGYTMTHYIRCYPEGVSSNSSNYWLFDGTVSLVQTGWAVTPGSSSKNPDLAKQKMETFFSGRAPDQVPYVDHDGNSKIIDNIRFSKLENNGVQVSNPQQNYFDNPGPVLVDYTNAADYNLNVKVLSTDAPGYAGWIDSLPVLKYELTFLEFYRFQPTVGTDVGKLVKEVIPGYIVRASTINRPYFEITDTYTDYNITLVKASRSENNYYSVKIQHYVTIRGINNSQVRVTFPNCSLASPNFWAGKGGIDAYLDDRIGYNVNVIPNISDQSSGLLNTFSLGDITLEPGESKVVYSGPVTSEIMVYQTVGRGEGYSPLYLNQTYVDDAVRNVAPSYFSWVGEMAFLSTGNQIVINPSGSDVLSLNNAYAKYKDKKDYKYKDIGFVALDGPKFIRKLSYFNGEGLAMKASDEVWAQIMANKILTSRVNPSVSSTMYAAFWPAMTYVSKTGWSCSLSYYNIFY